jgi:hypothetical protein
MSFREHSGRFTILPWATKAGICICDKGFTYCERCPLHPLAHPTPGPADAASMALALRECRHASCNAVGVGPPARPGRGWVGCMLSSRQETGSGRCRFTILMAHTTCLIGDGCRQCWVRHFGGSAHDRCATWPAVRQTRLGGGRRGQRRLIAACPTQPEASPREVGPRLEPFEEAGCPAPAGCTAASVLKKGADRRRSCDRQHHTRVQGPDSLPLFPLVISQSKKKPQYTGIMGNDVTIQFSKSMREVAGNQQERSTQLIGIPAWIAKVGLKQILPSTCKQQFLWDSQRHSHSRFPWTEWNLLRSAAIIGPK